MVMFTKKRPFQTQWLLALKTKEDDLSSSVLGYLFWFKRVKKGSRTLTEQVSRELFSAVCLDFRTKLMKLSCVPFINWTNQPLLVSKEEKLEIKESENKSVVLLSPIICKEREKSIIFKLQ